MMKSDNIQRRRAIYTGLQPYLGEEQLMEAMMLWEERYSERPGFSIRYFLADLEKSTQEPLQTKELLLNLVASLNSTDDELLPDPATLIQAYKRRRGIKDAAGQDATAEVEAFKMLVCKLLSMVDGPKNFDIVRYVSRSLDRVPIANELRFGVLGWLDNKNHPVKASRVHISDLRRITNLFYVALCEYLGPVKADQLLSKAVRQLLGNGGARYRDALTKLL